MGMNVRASSRGVLCEGLQWGDLNLDANTTIGTSPEHRFEVALDVTASLEDVLINEAQPVGTSESNPEIGW
jgi:hypothetical protein